jgi:hypothetical protein
VFRHQASSPTDTSATSPAAVREILFQVMALFPLNSMFLSLFIEGEARSQIAGRLRIYFDDVCDKLANPLLWIASIHTETTRLGSINRIRTLFERAVNNPK